jgi:antitoxin HicB
LLQADGYAATAPSCAALLKLLAESLTLWLDELADQAPLALANLDPEYQNLEADEEVIWLDPALLNPVSLELRGAIAANGLSAAEVARRAGMPRSGLSRLTDPLLLGPEPR